jgi:N-acetylglucosamine-6-sulfatase
MFLSTSAPHDPETPAPQYECAFSDVSAPRDAAFDLYPGRTKHWLTRMSPRTLKEDEVQLIDEKFRNRWRSLLSVDDMVADVVEILEQQVYKLVKFKYDEIQYTFPLLGHTRQHVHRVHV